MATFEFMDTCNQRAIIKVLGVGGGGGNAVQHMLSASLDGADFICANTDAQALKNISDCTVIQLGNNVTRGLGAGADPEKGRQAALEDRDRIMDVLEGSDMVFITAGMGGGTGTGAAPVVAQAAKEMGVLTVAVVTRPFSLEGKRRQEIANEGIKQMSQFVDSLIVIPNDKLLSVLGRDVSLLNAFKASNDVLLGAVQGIVDLIKNPGTINVDFADVRTVMKEMGMAMMGTGAGKGQNRARIAAEAAVASPLLEDISLSGAKGVLVNITAGYDLTLGEFEEVGNTVRNLAADTATVIVGTALDQRMTDEIRVTVVATGLGSPETQATNRGDMRSSSVSSKPRLVGKAESPASPSHQGRNDYASLDKPAYTRQSRNETQANQKSNANDNPDLFDIPAFLRRQAD